MYFSVASRTTHASDTFFSFAITSRVSYISGGKLIVARTCAVLWAFIFFPSPLFAMRAGLSSSFTAFHHIGEAKASPLPALRVSPAFCAVTYCASNTYGEMLGPWFEEGSESFRTVSAEPRRSIYRRLSVLRRPEPDCRRRPGARRGCWGQCPTEDAR